MRPHDWLSVVLLLLFAASLRIIGMSYGKLEPDYFPSYAPFGMVHEQLPVNPDSFLNVAIPINMALRNSLNPEFFNYPSFIINMNYLVNHFTGALAELSLADRDGLTFRNYAGFPLYVMARIWSVLGGMLMVACTYAIARIVRGRFAAMCAGLLVAVSFTLVTHAHYVKPSSLATGWTMVAMWACTAALYSSRQIWRERLYIGAGVATGLAASTFYNAAVVAMIVLPVGLILWHRNRTQRTLAIIVIAWLAIPVFFVLVSPYVLRDFRHFWQDFSVIVSQYKQPGQIHNYFTVDQWTGLALLLAYASLFAIGLPAIFCIALSCVAGWQKRLSGQFLQQNSILLQLTLIVPMLLAYVLVVLRTIRPGHSEHMLIQILPFAALMAAFGAAWLVERIPISNHVLMPIVLFVLIVQPLVLTVTVVRMFAMPDSRQIMLEWIHQHIPSGSRFFVNGSYNVPLDAAIYPNKQQFVEYVPVLPSPQEYDYMLYSDALAYDVMRSTAIVPPEIIQKQRDYLERLDATFARVKQIDRPQWIGWDSMMNMAAYYHNPGLILYCLNEDSCAAIE